MSASVGSSVNLGLEPWSGIEEVDSDEFARMMWSPWWLGNLAALLIITPALVLWATDFPRSFELRSVLESTAIFAAAGAFGALAFSPLMADIPSAAPLAVFAVLPPIWAALRRGPRDTATASLILLGFAAWGTIFGRSPLAVHGVSSTLVLVFMIGIATPQPRFGGRRSASQANRESSPRHPQGAGRGARAIRPIAKDGSRRSPHRWSGA